MFYQTDLTTCTPIFCCYTWLILSLFKKSSTSTCLCLLSRCRLIVFGILQELTGWLDVLWYHYSKCNMRVHAILSQLTGLNLLAIS